MSDIAKVQPDIMEKVIAQGDLSKLTPQERTNFYGSICKSLGLNPLTQPFEYITLNGRLRLYARKDCTDQLRRIHNVSLTIVSKERIDDCYVVTARASFPDGRCDEDVGSVSIANLKGEQLSNALMKAQTKAKRRVTLSICGLGFLDELETENISASIPPPPAPRVVEDVTPVKEPAKVETPPIRPKYEPSKVTQKPTPKPPENNDDPWADEFLEDNKPVKF